MNSKFLNKSIIVFLTPNWWAKFYVQPNFSFKINILKDFPIPNFVHGLEFFQSVCVENISFACLMLIY